MFFQRHRDVVDVTGRGFVSHEILWFAAIMSVAAPSTMGLSPVDRWVEREIVTSPDILAEQDRFGEAVASSGRLLVIGDHLGDGIVPRTGVVHVYDLETRRFVHRLALADGEERDFYGVSVAAHKRTILVGAQGHGEPRGGILKTGAAYAYDAVTGDLIYELIPADAEAGWAVGAGGLALNDEIMLVSATGADGYSEDSGAVYIFDRATGAEVQRLIAPVSGRYPAFGTDLDFQGDRLLVSAAGASSGYNEEGAAFLFDLSTGEFLTELTTSLPKPWSRFGQAVAIDGSRMVVAAPGYTHVPSCPPGRVAVYDVESTQEQHVFEAWDGFPANYLGRSIDLVEGLVLVGAPMDTFRGTESGAAYLFEVDSGAVVQKFTPNLRYWGGEFGTAVKIEGPLLIIGAPGDTRSVSGVWVFERITPSTLLAQKGACGARTRLVLSGATPGGRVVFGWDGTLGTFNSPGPSCPGVMLNLAWPMAPGSPQIVTASSDGIAGIVVNIDPIRCGVVFAQAMDFETCEVSNLLRIE